VVERRRDVPTVKSICSWPKRSHGPCGPAVGPDLPFRPMKRQVTSYLDNIRELPTVAQNNRLLPQTFTKNGFRSSSRYDSAIKPMIPQSREDGMHALHILRSDSEFIGLQTCRLAIPLRHLWRVCKSALQELCIQQMYCLTCTCQ
jgi:hypothetical protein